MIRIVEEDTLLGTSKVTVINGKADRSEEILEVSPNKVIKVEQNGKVLKKEETRKALARKTPINSVLFLIFNLLLIICLY